MAKQKTFQEELYWIFDAKEGTVESDIDFKKGFILGLHRRYLNIERDKQHYDTLKRMKMGFEAQSDHSTTCNGYKALCNMIEKIENGDFPTYIPKKD